MLLDFTKDGANIKFISVPFIKALFCFLISTDTLQYGTLEIFGKCFLINAPEADTHVFLHNSCFGTVHKRIPAYKRMADWKSFQSSYFQK